MFGNGSVENFGRSTARRAATAFSHIATVTALVSLAACGGGSKFSNGEPDIVTVSTAPEIVSITATSPAVGKDTHFVVTGRRLTNASLADQENNCDVQASTVAINNDGTTLEFNCTPKWFFSTFVAVDNQGNQSLPYEFDLPNPQVTIHTKSPDSTEGVIVVELEPKKAPETVRNFLQYVFEGFYTDVIFHRAPGAPGDEQVIQAGEYQIDPVSSVVSSKVANNPAITLETNVGLNNIAGTIGMARNTDPNSATASFYFNVENNSPAFDYQSPTQLGYAVFGHIVGSSGLDAVKAIRDLGQPNPLSTATRITSIEITKGIEVSE